MARTATSAVMTRMVARLDASLSSVAGVAACPEAIAVHYLDNIDAKLQMSMADIRDSKNAESDWTEFNRALGTRVYKKDVMGIRSKPTKG